MKKRDFLKVGGTIAAGALVLPVVSCKNTNKEEKGNKGELYGQDLEFVLPTLAFAPQALEPHIDQRTMTIHHAKHHAGYVKKLNAALEKSNVTTPSLEHLLENVTEDQEAIRNNGGGHYNHSLFWEILTPKAPKLPEEIKNAIDASFGSFENFKNEFSNAASSVFGSGWAWLCKDENNKLFVSNTPNQDNPLMKNLVEKVGSPILGIDVWEHAYYLNYQNRRGDYIDNFFNIINWNKVNDNLKA